MAGMTVTMETLHDARDAWEELHALSAAPLFASASWLEVLAEVFERDARVAMLSVDGAPRCGIPLLSRRRGNLRLVTALPITLYAGRCARGVCTDEQLGALLDRIEGDYHLLTLSDSFSENELRVFTSRGWDVREQRTLRVDLRDADALWKGYSQSLRRKLRKAATAQLTLHSEPSTDSILALFEHSYRRHDLTPPFSMESMRAWLELLRTRGMVECHAAVRPDGTTAAVRVIMRDGGMLYDWLAGADPALCPFASHWLVHTLLTRGAAQGCATFDFMGANTAGVSDFKRSFGSVEHVYHNLTWYRSVLMKYLLRVHEHRGRSKRVLS